MISRNRFVKLLLALCLAAHLNAQQDIRPLTILHTNDLHAHIQPDNDGMGGFAYLATALRNERAHCEACLYLDAGDLVQGTPVSTIYHGEPIYELANLLKPDASTLGNHELDYGWNEAGKFVTIAKFPIVSSNILNAVGQPVTGKPYVIQTVGGIRVAVIGAVLGDLATALTTPEEMGPWRVIPPVDAIRSVVAEIGGRADLIVVVAHIHSDETEKILHTIPQVAVVVAGHEHNGYRGLKKIDGRVAVEVQAYGVELGRLDLRVDVPHHTIVSADWKRIPINSKTISPDTEMAAAVAGWEAKVSKIVDVPIGVAKHTIAHRDLRTLVERARPRRPAPTSPGSIPATFAMCCRKANCWRAMFGTSCPSTIAWCSGISSVASFRRRSRESSHSTQTSSIRSRSQTIRWPISRRRISLRPAASSLPRPVRYNAT